MAKKLLTAIAALFLLFCFAACGGNPETHIVTFRQSGYEDVVKSVEHGEELTDVPLPRPKEGYEVVWDRTNFANITEDLVVTAVETPVPADCTVTFRQTGYDDIVKTVKRGEGLAPADIPAVRQKDGYTCVWQTVDFSVVTEDIVIFAVETPNVYVIFFELQTDEILEAGGVEITQLSVQYGKPYQLPTPEKIGYAFAGWNVKDSETKFADGVYLTLGNVTLTPNWTPDENGGWTSEYPGEQYVLVVFREAGYPDIVKVLDVGETLTDIPSVHEETGYNVVWDRTDFENVTENLVVTAIKTPKSYTITYEIDDKTGWLIDGDSWEQTVRYGEEFALKEPAHLEKKFLKWIVKDTQEEFIAGKWNRLEGVTLVAVWEESESWTGEYPGEN